MKAETLAAALLADRNRPTTTNHNIIDCFSCGRTFVYKGRQGELNGRFCSLRCQEWYDAAGNPSFEQQRERKPVNGFLIDCAHCRKEFDSKGLRCCSADCERSYREREANLAVMAEAGIEAKPKRQCEQCGAVIPQWRNGRKVKSNTRFCTPLCQERAKTAERKLFMA